MRSREECSAFQSDQHYFIPTWQDINYRLCSREQGAPVGLHQFNCLSRLQLYTDVHGHITNLDKEVCMTNVWGTTHTDQTAGLCKHPFPDLWRCGEQPHANSYSYTLMFTDISQIWIKRCAWQMYEGQHTLIKLLVYANSLFQICAGR